MKENMQKVKLAKNGISYLNLGCGLIYNKDWNNVDLIKNKDIIYYDISKGIPFGNNSLDVVYASHVLEHLSYESGKFLLNEINRVLKKNGVIRIAVPDLEIICKEYINNLENVLRENTEVNRQNYEWVFCELIDQMVREKSGGKMLEKLTSKDFNKDYVKKRNGDEFLDIMECEKKERTLLDKIKNKTVFELIFYPINFIFRSKIQKSIFNAEKHRWMYDRYSLTKLLKENGFSNVIVRKYNESNIPDWNFYNLDRSNKGEYPRKQDSLYMEGIK